MRARKTVFPEGHWSLQVDIPFSMGVACGDLFHELDAGLENLVKSVVFYVPDEGLCETDYIGALAAMLPTVNRPVITLVPVPRMFYPGLVVEIDAYGVAGDAIERIDIRDDNGFSTIVRAGEMIFGAGIDAGDADDLHGNVTIRGSYFQKPGPASTGIPFRCLAYDGMVIEIEAIAMTGQA